jgi:peptidyl-prolyl cis-trans isomerase A (cyclophilin A)
MKKLMIAFLLSLFAGPAIAQTTPTPAPALPRVALETSSGRIVIEVDTAHAPVTAANFLRYVDARRLDGVAFYRIVRLESDFGIVQFGLGGDPKKAFPPIKHEPTTQTGIKHTNGAISMARNAPGTARAEFTISIGNQWSLDADPAKPGDNLGYPAFGHVIEGMEVVTGILNAAVSPTKSLNGAYKGQMPEAAVKIVTARRVAR